MNQPKIVSDSKILAGKPAIAGTRISVELISGLIASGMSEKEILCRLSLSDSCPNPDGSFLRQK